MPAALGTDQDVRVRTDGDGAGSLLQIRNDFDIFEIGKNEGLRPFKLTETEPSPKVHKTRLGMRVGPAIALLASKREAGLGEKEGGAAFAKLLADGHALEFHEIGEEPHPQTSDRLVAHISQQMRGGEVVAVILLVIGA